MTNRRGFTMIETMLFLAITGVLVVVILAGSGVAINQQRYRDSVNSFASFLQAQYADATSVHNDRGATWTCSDTGGLKLTPTGGDSRGASQCDLLGQVIRSTDGNTITVDPVIGYNETRALTMKPTPTSDVAMLQAMSLQSLGSVDSSQTQSQQLEWGAKLVNKDGSPAAFSILIVKSPLSGTLRTFAASGSSAGTISLGSLVNTANLQTDLLLCVDPQGLMATGTGMDGVELLPGSASSAGVRITGVSAC